MNDLPGFGIRLHNQLTARQSVELASAAERAGFTAAWFAENAFARGILPAAAACAAATRRLRIGAGVFNPFSRHPTMMAMEIGALDELSDGRASIGIGAGIGSAVQKIGQNSEKPVIALRDTLAIVRPLLRGERVNYAGRAFSAREVKLDYPTRHDIPMYLAGRGELTLKLAGEAADGLLISNMCSLDFAARAASAVSDSRAKAGRDGIAGIVQYMPCAVRKDRDEALIIAKRAVGEMLPGFWALSQKLPSAKEGLFLGTNISDQEFSAAVGRLKSGENPGEVLSDKIAQAFSLCGTPDECIERARAYAKAGINELALTFDGSSAVHDMELLGQVLRNNRG
jgi:5,10-methylenetetrahydromethanopterin reductase